MRKDRGASFVSSLGDSFREIREDHEINPSMLDTESLHIEGRSREISQLHEAFVKVQVTGLSHLVLVHGASGSGKSSLVEKLRNLVVIDDHAYFISGKFDQYNENDMFSGFVSAFSDLCDLVYQSRDVDAIRSDLSVELKDDLNSLTRRIPSLYLVTGMANEVGVTKALTDNSRIKFQILCLKFLHIMSKRKPTVIFLDDFQWANDLSRDMLTSLFSDGGDASKNLLVICSYRDDEFEIDLPISAKDCAQCYTIKVENLDLGSINQIIAMLTLCNPAATRLLSEIVYSKTGGNPYHTLQYLESLVTEKLLVYSESSDKWIWDLDRIQAGTNVSDNIVGIVSTKIRRVPDETQKVLKVAALLGFSFNLNVLKTVVAVSSSGEDCPLDPDCNFDISPSSKRVEKCLELATRERLIEQGKTNEMKFTHDRVHECVVALVGDDREALHLRIGRILREALRDESEGWLVLLTTEQMYRGISLVQTRDEIIGLAELNLKAAKVATSRSAFDLAMKYLQAGMLLVNRLDDPWSERYDFCRDLFSSGAEVSLSIGSFEEGEKIIDEVITHSGCLDDKLPAYYCKVKIIGALGRDMEAIHTAISVLRESGDKFPRKPSRGHVAIELVKTRRLVRRMKDDAFMSLPIQTETKRVYGMKLMSEIVTRGQICSSKEFFSVACLRMVRSTIQHGLSAHSIYGLGKYGMILYILGATDEAYRIGRLTMRLLDRLDDTDDIETKCILSVYGFLNHVRQPVKEGRDVLIRAYRRGMLQGDVQWAIVAGVYVCMLAFCYGDNLEELESHMKDLHTFSKAFNVKFTLGLFLTTVQAVHNLLGRSENAAILKGNAMDEFEALPGSTEGFPAWSRAFYEFLLSCYFDDWGQAEQIDDEMQRYALGGSFARAHFTYPCFFLFVGIMCFARYRESGKRVYQSRANKYINFASNMVMQGMVSFLPVLSVLLAERAAISGSDTVVQQAYDSAIVTAVAAGMSNFAGVTNERAATHFWQPNIRLAKAYLLDAKEQYIRYGSPVLVEKVEEKLAFFRKGNRRHDTPTGLDIQHVVATPR